jgi:hypothetical protein
VITSLVFIFNIMSLLFREEWNFSNPVAGGHNGVSTRGHREKSYRKVYSVENDGHDEPAVFHHRHHHHHRPHKHKHKHRKESSPLSPSVAHKRSVPIVVSSIY